MSGTFSSCHIPVRDRSFIMAWGVGKLKGVNFGGGGVLGYLCWTLWTNWVHKVQHSIPVRGVTFLPYSRG